MRKILEVALQDGGAAIVETQRLKREMLADTKPTREEKAGTPPPPSSSSLGLAQTARSATASDLADQLEPSSSMQAIAHTKKRTAKWPFIVLALVVLGGGAATAALLLNKKQAPAGYVAKNKITGVPIKAGKVFENQLLVETDGVLTPEEIAPLYKSMFDELAAFEPGVEAQRDVIQEIVAVPQASLCDESIFRASQIPCSHKDTFATALRGKRRLLIISDDRATLAVNLRTGVAQAVCDFQFLWLTTGTDEENWKKNDAICKMTKRFIGAK
jgi:hypothetical protein